MLLALIIGIQLGYAGSVYAHAAHGVGVAASSGCDDCGGSLGDSGSAERCMNSSNCSLVALTAGPSGLILRDTTALAPATVDCPGSEALLRHFRPPRLPVRA